VIKLVILALFGYLGWKAWRVLRGSGPERRAEVRGPERRLVHDPQCNTYVPEQTAERLRVKGKVVYFCSPECRQAYLKKTEGESA